MSSEHLLGDPIERKKEKEIENQTNSDQDYKKYGSRWVIMFCFCLASFVNAILWICFAPIEKLVKEYYGIDSTQVNTLSVVFLALYIPATILSVSFFHAFGFRKGMIFGCFLNFLGGWIRFISTEVDQNNPNYPILLTGQILAAIGQPFFTNIPAMVAANWFPIAERDLAVVVCSMFNVVGIAFGQAFPPQIVTVKDDVQTLLLIEAILVSISMIFTLIFVREKPPSPPSRSAEIALQHSSSHSVKEMLIILQKDVLICCQTRDFLILLATFGPGLGVFNALATLLSQFVAPVGYSDDDSGNFGAGLIGTGIVFAGIIGAYLDKTHRYKSTLKILWTLAAISFCFLVLILRPNQFTLVLIAFSLAGGFVMPLLPVTLECAIECTFPIKEDVSGAILVGAGNAFGIGFIYILGALIDLNPNFDGNVFVPYSIATAATPIVLAVISYFFNGRLLRLESEKLQKLQQIQES